MDDQIHIITKCFERTTALHDEGVFSSNDASIYYEAILYIEPGHVAAKEKATAMGNDFSHKRPAKQLADEVFNHTGTLAARRKLSDPGDMLAYLSLCIAIDPPHYDASTRIVKMMCIMGDEQDAADLIGHLIEDQGETIQAQLLMADFNRYTKQTDAALRWMRAAYQHATEDSNEDLQKECEIRLERLIEDISSGKLPPLSGADGFDAPSV